MTTQISSTLAELGRANSTITAETLWLDLARPRQYCPCPRRLRGSRLIRRVGDAPGCVRTADRIWRVHGGPILGLKIFR
jgi:hypothetical protein